MAERSGHERRSKDWQEMEGDVLKKQKLELSPTEEPYDVETLAETVVVTSTVGDDIESNTSKKGRHCSLCE